MSTCLVLVVAVLLGYRIWLGRSRALDGDYEPTHYVQTADGARLALYRRANPGRDAILMVHGLGANHFNFDFPHAGSPAALYHDAGYDVWTLDLRGHGHSSHGGGGWYNWGFDDFVSRDLPTVLDFLARETNGAAIHWLGHSMGGMLLYALPPEYAAKIKSAVALGSPISFYPSSRLERWAYRNGTLLMKLRIFPIQMFLRWLNPLLPWGPAKAIASQMCPENVDWQTISRAAYHSTSNVSMKLMMDFARWVATDLWDSASGQVDYRARLAAVQAPLLIVAGSEDRLCPAKDIRRAFELAGSVDKDFLVAGPEPGFQCDYGHIDLVFGRHAGQETIERAIAWTDRFVASG